MDYLKANLEALAKRRPDLAARVEAAALPPEGAIEASRRGAPSLRLGQVRLTSSVDPVDEGLKQARSAPRGPLVVLGFGLGYHLEALTGRKVAVWEPDPGLLRLAFSARDLTGLLSKIQLATELDELGDIEGRECYIHPPTARLYPVETIALKRRLAPRPKVKARPDAPRVLVVPPIKGGSLPVARWCAEALRELGCRVEMPPADAVAPLYEMIVRTPLGERRTDRVLAPLVRFLGETSVLKAEEFKPHLVLALAQAPLDRRAIADLSGMGARTAFWFVEDFRLMTYYREVAASYDFFFHIQGEELEQELGRLSANHSRLPMAAHPPVHRPLFLSREDRETYGAPVGFMGAGYPNRRRIFGELAGQGLPLKLWGVSWPSSGPLASRLAQGNRRLTSDEVSMVYNACDIVLNLHSSPQAETEIGGADFVNPRTFEVPACGGFMLTDRAGNMEEFLEPGREVAVFNTPAELLEMARHYLARPGERAHMARAARKKILAGHTYYHRMERLLTTCLGPAGPGAERRTGDDPASLMQKVLAPQGAE